MKIVQDKMFNNVYKYDASEQRAALVLDIVKAFWDNYDGPKVSEDSYYKINRAIGDCIEKRIKIVSARYEVDYEFRKQVTEDYVISFLTRKIADEIAKSEVTSIIDSTGEYGRQVYQLSIPIIARVER